MSKFTIAVAAYFRERPNRWIDGLEIAKVGGAYGSRTRISECRCLLGMDIDNRQRPVGDYRVSEYLYRPPAPERTLLDLLDETGAAA